MTESTAAMSTTSTKCGLIIDIIPNQLSTLFATRVSHCVVLVSRVVLECYEKNLVYLCLVLELL